MPQAWGPHATRGTVQVATGVCVCVCVCVYGRLQVSMLGCLRHSWCSLSLRGLSLSLSLARPRRDESNRAKVDECNPAPRAALCAISRGAAPTGTAHADITFLAGSNSNNNSSNKGNMLKLREEHWDTL